MPSANEIPTNCTAPLIVTPAKAGAQCCQTGDNRSVLHCSRPCGTGFRLSSE